MKVQFSHLAVSFLLTVLLCGCQAQGTDEPDAGTAAYVPLSERIKLTEDADIPFLTAGAAEITLSDDKIETDSPAVTVDGTIVTIRQGGSYIVTGTLSDGMLIVESDKSGEVQILLRDAHITSSTGAALYVACADATRLYTDAGTENTLASSYDFSQNTETNIDAALFSRDDLYLSGDGALTLVSAYGHGAVSKDDLYVVSGTYDIKSAGHGISGKDSVTVYDGAFAIDCGKDGIHAENNDDTTLGNLYLLNGAYEITSVGDGLSASAVLQIDGGDYALTTGGGAANGKTHTDDMFGGNRGGFFGGWGADSTDSKEAQGADSTTAVDSAKGIKAQSQLYITGGTFSMDTSDDAIHANGDIVVENGMFTIATGDDAIHADNALTVSGGEIDVTQSWEGLEGTQITLSGGHVTVNADDDGINAAGGADGSGFLGFGGGWDMFSSDGVSAVTIAGGNLYINADGDGLDSNGDLTITGGEIYVDGPTNSANGAIDCAGEAVISGGTLVAVGAAGMAESFDSTSTQGVALVTLSGTQTAAALALYDADGTLLLSHNPAKSYNAVYVSCHKLQVGGTYTLVTGTLETPIAMDSVVVGSSGFGFGGFGGDMGGGKGNRGDRGDAGDRGQQSDGVTPPTIPDGGGMPGMENDESGSPVVPEMPEGGFDFGQMPGGFGGEVPEGMTPPQMPENGQMPQGGFGGMTPPGAG